MRLFLCLFQFAQFIVPYHSGLDRFRQFFSVSRSSARQTFAAIFVSAPSARAARGDNKNALLLPIIHQREAVPGKASRWKAEWDWCLVLADDLLTDEKRNDCAFQVSVS